MKTIAGYNNIRCTACAKINIVALLPVPKLIF